MWISLASYDKNYCILLHFKCCKFYLEPNVFNENLNINKLLIIVSIQENKRIKKNNKILVF